MRRLERGASYVPLIIVVVLLIVAIVWAYIKHDEVDKLQKDLKAAKDKETVETERGAEIRAYLVKLSDVLGFAITDPTETKKSEFQIDFDKVEQHILQKLEELKGIQRTFKQGVYEFPPEEQGGIVTKTEGENITVGYIESGRIPTEATVEMLYDLMLSGMRRMLVDLNGMHKALEDEKARYAEYRQGHDAAIEAKKSEIETLRNEKSSLQASLIQKEADLKAEISGLEDRNKALEVELEDERKERRAEKAAANNEISALKQNVVKLKQRKRMVEEPIGPDGQILAVTEGQGIAIIDRGKDHHLQAGLSFDVYTLGKGAQKVYKGSITVLDVYDYTAKVRIIDLKSPMMPMVQGDYIESLTYNPDEKLSFVLIGRFKKYGRSDAAKRIQQLGQTVQDMVSIDTHYLVMGAPESEDQNLEDTDAYKKAKELGVKIITERQLSSFLRY
jgi:NAD-dependent DNA ligase